MKNLTLLFILFGSIALSAQMPSFKATIHDSSAVKGYFFMVSQQHLLILDKNGEVVYFKKGYDDDNFFKIQSNAEMSYFDNGKFCLMDSTFSITDSVSCKNYQTDCHELIILPNGHFLLFGIRNVKMDLSSYNLSGRQGFDSSIVLSEVIQELDAKREVVFECRAIDLFAFDDVDTFRYSMPDPWWVHWNSFDLDKDGNILVSSRNFNEITKINRKNGSIMWRLGGKRNQFKFINCPVPFYAQRNIKVLANGNITFLDGGFAAVPHSARAMEFHLDEKKKTATLEWSHESNISEPSLQWGNVQRLAHRNTLINFGGISGTSPLCFTIVNASGRELFRLNGPHAFRVYYYDALPFQLHRPQITCIDSSGVKYLDAGAGYDAYIWSTGDSARIIPVTKPQDYYVFVPYGDEGYISSEKITISDIANPCSSLPEKNFKKQSGKKEK